MWVFTMIILSVCETWSLDPVIKNLSFNLGRDANLTCSDKTWSVMIYAIWKIDLKYKQCKISRSSNANEDTCNDGKSLHNTTRYQSYLHIPNFSNDDVGIYNCETAYRGGLDAYTIYVSITVPPSISAWLEWKDNKMIAVCKAEKGKPAANISWSHTGNSSTLETQLGLDGLFTVESHLEVPESMDTKNLTCIIRHPYWETQRILEPKHTKGSYFTLLIILMVVIPIIVILAVITIVRKKLTILRCGRQAETSPSTSLKIEDVGDEKLQSSYIQRINSIYNS
ncbi:hypothetical protein PAMP_003676 [Pampus punctatissimus]